MTDQPERPLPPSQSVDMAACERDYRAGIMSVAEIGRRYGVSANAVRKWAKARSWDRELEDRVRRAIANRAIRKAVGKPIVLVDGSGSGSENLVPVPISANSMTDDQIVEAFAEAGANAIELHRRDLVILRNRRNRLMRHWELAVPDLSAPPPIGPDGKPLPVVPLSLEDIATANTILEGISRIDERIVKIERQALQIDRQQDEAPAPDPEAVAKAEASRQLAFRILGDLARRVSSPEPVTLDGLPSEPGEGQERG